MGINESTLFFYDINGEEVYNSSIHDNMELYHPYLELIDDDHILISAFLDNNKEIELVYKIDDVNKKLEHVKE